jgi:hypothetical protein
MRKFMLSTALALLVLGSLSPLNAEAQRRRSRGVYYSYPTYEYAAPTYSYYYAPDTTVYSAPAVTVVPQATTSYYYAPTYPVYSDPAVSAYYYGPAYYGGRRYGRFGRR